MLIQMWMLNRNRGDFGALRGKVALANGLLSGFNTFMALSF